MGIFEGVYAPGNGAIFCRGRGKKVIKEKPFLGAGASLNARAIRLNVITLFYV